MAGSGRAHAVAPQQLVGRPQRVAEMGERVLAWKEPGMIAKGIYKFKYFMVFVDGGQTRLPPALTSDSPLIKAGRLLNDNIEK